MNGWLQFSDDENIRKQVTVTFLQNDKVIQEPVENRPVRWSLSVETVKKSQDQIKSLMRRLIAFFAPSKVTFF